jgi:hypothetical protein
VGRVRTIDDGFRGIDRGEALSILIYYINNYRDI